MSIDFLSFPRWRASGPRNLRGLDCAGLAASVLIAAVMGGLLILPVHREMGELDRQLEAEKRLLKRAVAIESKHEQAIEDQAAQNEKLARLMALVPTQPDEEKFLAEISLLAQSSELQLRQFQPQEAKTVNQYREIPIHIVASGTYAATCRFLHGLKDLSRLAEVVSLRLGPESLGPKSAEPSPLLLDLNVKIYFQSEAKAKP